MLGCEKILNTIKELGSKKLEKYYTQILEKQDFGEICDNLRSHLTESIKKARKNDKGKYIYTKEMSILELLITICYYNLNDFKTALLLSAHGEQDEEPDQQIEFIWINIHCLQKLNLLNECSAQIDKFISLIDKDEFKSIETYIKEKKDYIMKFQQKKKLDDIQLAELSQRIFGLMQKQEHDNYFTQHGYPAYLVPVSWMMRFNQLTNMHLLTKQNIQKVVIDSNSQLDLEQMFEQISPFCSLEMKERLTKIVEQETTDLLQCPIWGDDLIDPTMTLSIDTLRPKLYTNYRLKEGLREGEDYIVVSSDIWKVLHQNFEGREIRRFVIRKSDKVQQVEVNLRLIPYMLYPFSDPMYVQIISNELVEDLQIKLKRIHNQTIINMWKVQQDIDMNKLSRSLQVDGTRLHNENTIDGSEIGINDMLIVELTTQSPLSEKQQITQKNSGVKNACRSCGEEHSKLYYCECKSVKYCGKLCLEKDRKFHQDDCRKILNKDQFANDQARKFKIKNQATLGPNSNYGICGLQNLGNTCFMNSSLQCLSHVTELTKYMIMNEFVADLNDKNPLGTGGRLACAYSDLLKDLWESNQNSVSPWNLKNVIGKYASQFSGYNQQDSQELLSYLLDGLHEDLNRVKRKPYVNNDIEYKGQPDPELASFFWNNHLARNNSIITDLFTGQFKSQVQCPDCRFISVTFDPFVSVSLPIPNKEYLSITFYLVFRDSTTIPLKTQLRFPSTTLVSDIIEYVTKQKNLNMNYFTLYSLVDNSIDKPMPLSYTLKNLKESQNYYFLYEEIDPVIDNKLDEKGKNYEFHIEYFDISQKRGYENRPSLNKASYTRFFYLPLNATYHDLAITLYKINRPFLLLLLDYQQTLPIDFDKFLKHIKAAQVPNYEQEYQMMTQLEKEPYQLYDKYPNVIKSTKDQIQSGQTVIFYQLVFNQFIRSECLKLNRCADSEFNNIDQPQKQNQCNLFDCLQQFCQEEILGQEDQWYCSKCKQHKRASKKMEIYKAPNILILHLKRFRSSRSYGYFMSGSSKLSVYVDFPVSQFDINNFVLDKSKSYVYDLFAVSNHYGGLGGGHYTAYAKSSNDNRWYDFNDASVRDLKSSPQSDAAYVLFYRLKQ